MRSRHIQTADDFSDQEILAITDDIINGTREAVMNERRAEVMKLVFEAMTVHCHGDSPKGFRANIRQNTSTFVRRLRERREAILKQMEATVPKSSRRRW